MVSVELGVIKGEGVRAPEDVPEPLNVPLGVSLLVGVEVAKRECDGVGEGEEVHVGGTLSP